MGQKGTGKDTVAKILQNTAAHNKQRLTKVVFADPLRKFIWNLIGDKIGDKRHLWGSFSDKQEEIKTLPITREASKIYVVLKEYKYWTGSLILQYTGTEAFRVYRTKSAIDLYLDLGSNIVVTDCRFPSEYSMLCETALNRNVEITNIMVSRPGYEGEGHAGKSHIDSFEYDVSIINESSFKNLRAQVSTLWCT